MKSIDFTHPGGFPLTQDQLDYLQQAYTECLDAIAMMGGAGPVIISGMTTTISGSLVSLSDGWLFYNGEIIKFNASSYSNSGIPPGFVPIVLITPSAGILTYNDGSTFGAVQEKTAKVTIGATGTTATQFPLDQLQPFQIAFGLNGREAAWNSLIVNTPAANGGVTGTIFYKKNFLNNTLHIRSFLSANNAQNFNASPTALFYLMGVFPTGYIPVNDTYFIAQYFLGSQIKDDLGVGWVKQISCGLNSGGQFLINWIRPDVSISGYSINFNTIIPLD